MKVLDFDSMLKAYRNGDINLDQFPDSIEKQTLLQTIDKWKSEMSIRKLSSSEISDLKMELNSSNEVEKTRIILDVLDTCDTSNDELKEIFTDHKELLSIIRKLMNKKKTNPFQSERGRQSNELV